MNKVFLGLGANLGSPYNTLKKAIELIKNINGINFQAASSFYTTSPVSNIPQGDFLNLVCKIETELDIEKLFLIIENIEIYLGKKVKGKQEPRIIDIDILFFGNESIQTETLQIPHKEWSNRLFVLVPLKEISDTIDLPNGEKIDLEHLINNFSSTPKQYISLFQTKNLGSLDEKCVHCQC